MSEELSDLPKSSFYKRSLLSSFSSEEEEDYLIYKKLAPLAKKLKVKAKDRNKYRARQDLFDFDPSKEALFPEEEVSGRSAEWLDKDFAFQLAYDMEDLKSLKWYEYIVGRCDRLKERQILLRAKGEVMELKDTSEEPGNKGAYFSRLVRKYAQEREISLADYTSGFKGKNNVFQKREIIKRKRKDINKVISEIKDTLSVEELCYYHKRALELIDKECGAFFRDNGIDIPPYVIKSYVKKVIAKDYKLTLPSGKRFF